jgi:SagB-type dehydrogenase family enzyme
MLTGAATRHQQGPEQRHKPGAGARETDVQPFDQDEVAAFVRRLRGSFDDIYPGSWQIDWQNIPSPFRWYETTQQVELPPMPRRLVRGGAPQAVTVAQLGQLSWLGALLQASYGVAGIRWYPEGTAKSSPEQPAPVHRDAHYQLRRAVPSGGVTYPAACYVCTDGDAELAAGVYHYNAVRHSLARLATGRPPAGLASPDGGVRIVLTIPLWKNYFKYGDFSYRLAALDSGTVLGQFALTARRWGWTCRVSLVGAELPLLRGLGLDPSVEAAPVVLDVRPAPTGGARGSGSAPGDGTRTAAVPDVPWRGAMEMPDCSSGARRMHAACLATAGKSVDLPPIQLDGLPVDAQLPAAAGDPPTVADAWARTALGEQYRSLPVSMDDVANWSAELLAPLDGSVPAGTAGVPAHPRCLLIARSVGGLPAGAYLLHGDGRGLTRTAEGDFGPLVQRCLFGSYMNFAQAPLIAVLVGGADVHCSPSGAVAYRAQHLLGGLFAQRLSVAATRDGLSAHPVLGFVSGPLDDALGLAARGLTSLLLVGISRYRRALYLESSTHPVATGDGGGS